MNCHRLRAAVLLGVTALTAGLALSGVDGPLRTVVTIVFFLVVPGWAVVAFARPSFTSVALAVSVGLSLALDLLVAQAMLLVGWRPMLAFGLLLGLSAVALTVHLVRPATGVTRES